MLAATRHFWYNTKLGLHKNAAKVVEKGITTSTVTALQHVLGKVILIFDRHPFNGLLPAPERLNQFGF